MAKILVIEADANLSEAIVTILEIAGHETICATDGRMGVALALEQQPAFIFCETTLPRLNGYEVLARLRQEMSTAHIPIVLMTSHLANRDLERGLDLGASGFLIKPFTETELLRKLDTGIGE